MCHCNFSKLGEVSGKWVLGDELSSDGSWDKHIKPLIVCTRQKLGGLYQVLHCLRFKDS